MLELIKRLVSAKGPDEFTAASDAARAFLLRVEEGAPPGRLYMPHAAHLIVGRWCAFHLATALPNGYLVSTVGEYRPSFSRRHMDRIIATGSREPLQARADDEPCEEIGLGSPGRPALYETMVFRSVRDESKCCPFRQESGEDLECARYSTADEATVGHEAMCQKWEAMPEVARLDVGALLSES